MPEFQYTARELTGHEVNGMLTAANEQEVVQSLSARQLFPLQIDLARQSKSEQRSANRRVRPRQVAMVYSQLSDLLSSGVPLLRSLDLLVRQSSHLSLKLVLEDVRDQVADGKHLAESMQRHPKVFNELTVSMVRAGEEGSFLEEVLKRTARFTEHQEELKSRVVGAMAYPVFLLVVGILLVTAMMVFFVPKFTPIFDRLAERDGLPWATTTLMGISGFLADYGLLLLVPLVGGTLLLVRFFRTERGRFLFDRIRLRAAGLGPIVRSLAIARFCRILGTLMRNGVPILQSLRISKDATGNVVLSRAVARAAESVSAGRSLAQPLEACGEFPADVIEMIAVGEESNNLEQVLIDIAENMERRTYRQLELFVRLLEPVMLLIMAAMVLFVVSGLLLPVFQSSGAL